MKTHYKKIIIIFIIIISFFTVFSTIYAATATTPTLVNKLNNALKKIQSYLVKIAAPAAGVAIATGVLMRKLSFGDDEKIRTGKKLIRTALISYVFIILLRLILTTISNLLSS